MTARRLKMGLVRILPILTILLLAWLTPKIVHAQNRVQAIRCVHMFFDLGNTLVDTTNRTPDGDIAKVLYFPGVPEYLQLLSQKGYRLGMVSNVPPEWGVPGLQQYVDGRWADPRFKRFAWSIFNPIIVPSKVEDRKPSTKMFCQAVKYAAARGCVAVYQGEDHLLPAVKRTQIIRAARAAGMVAVLVDMRPPLEPTIPDPLNRKTLLMPGEIESLIQQYPPRQMPGACL